jgi:hypothetical protein
VPAVLDQIVELADRWKEAAKAAEAGGLTAPNEGCIISEYRPATLRFLVEELHRANDRAIPLDDHAAEALEAMAQNNDPTEGPEPPNHFRIHGWLIKGLTPSEMKVIENLWGSGTLPTVGWDKLYPAVYGPTRCLSDKDRDKLERHLKNARQKLTKQTKGQLTVCIKDGTYRIEAKFATS